MKIAGLVVGGSHLAELVQRSFDSIVADGRESFVLPDAHSLVLESYLRKKSDAIFENHKRRIPELDAYKPDLSTALGHMVEEMLEEFDEQLVHIRAPEGSRMAILKQ